MKYINTSITNLIRDDSVRVKEVAKCPANIYLFKVNNRKTRKRCQKDPGPRFHRTSQLGYGLPTRERRQLPVAHTTSGCQWEQPSTSMTRGQPEYCLVLIYRPWKDERPSQPSSARRQGDLLVSPLRGIDPGPSFFVFFYKMMYTMNENLK